ncbi:AbrB/MazE/SpoVT family DNA-binding domain-containing protein [Candidatus Nitrososphaera sp. FF02]|uniref:AbrB/MazE/SpoVT family DNA-binding domain-containing protein n=1 Tax=Candidatus Nitrososphaera sp. FF02 TaxID=3398226 RepID=UPI0039E77BBD
MPQEAEITTMSEKGQVVIPQKIRKNLKIKPRTKFAVYTKNDMIIMKAFEVPGLEKVWAEIFGQADKKNLKVTEKQV